jgi:hypothetical protein
MLELKHAMRPEILAEERARQNFVAGLRSFVLNDLADDMRLAYDNRVKPEFERQQGRAPETGPEVHRAMRGDPMFSLYSALRVNAQWLAPHRSRAPGAAQRHRHRRASDAGIL